MKIWRVLKTFNHYKGWILPAAGLLLVGLKKLETLLAFWNQISDSNSVPSDRPQKVGESDGTYTQVHSTIGKKSDPKPVGVKQETTTELEGQGEVKPLSSPANDKEKTKEAMDETEKYLGN